MTFTHNLNRASNGNLDYLIKRLSELDPNKVWTVTASEYKKKRSNQQNRWVRGFAKELGAHLGYSADEMYELIMYKHNPVFITDKETGEVVRMAGHFSKLNTADAAKVQEQIEIWAAGLGFVLPNYD